MSRENIKELIEEQVPMTAKDYERLIHLIGQNLILSIKNIQLAIEATQLTSRDDEFKNELECFMQRAAEIEKYMHKAVLKSCIKIEGGLDFKN